MNTVLNTAVATLLTELSEAIAQSGSLFSPKLEALREAASEVDVLLNEASGEHSAAELLVLAYANGEPSGSVEWEDLNVAYQRACQEVGDKRVVELTELADLAAG